MENKILDRVIRVDSLLLKFMFISFFLIFITPAFAISITFTASNPDNATNTSDTTPAIQFYISGDNASYTYYTYMTLKK